MTIVQDLPLMTKQKGDALPRLRSGQARRPYISLSINLLTIYYPYALLLTPYALHLTPHALHLTSLPPQTALPEA